MQIRLLVSVFGISAVSFAAGTEKPSAIGFRSHAALAAGTQTQMENKPPTLNAAPLPTQSAQDVSPQTGLATFFGKDLHGRVTSSGEALDNSRLTAAHATLPFGTRVRVTRVSTGRSVVVTITGRGSFTGNRVISVSSRAAEELGFIQAGTTEVRIEQDTDRSGA